ncbi:hypothetical protein KUCAC02_033566, partial [Chaenocephalus aceratus]
SQVREKEEREQRRQMTQTAGGDISRVSPQGFKRESAEPGGRAGSGRGHEAGQA